MDEDRLAEILEQFHLCLLLGADEEIAEQVAELSPADNRLADALDSLRRIERARGASAEPAHPDAGQTEVCLAGEVRPPRQIARFEIVRVLGEGGQAIVFLAWDPSARRQVALKLPRPGVLFSARMRARFLREGFAAARLNHPHIVTTLEVGQVDGVPYLVSAYGRGRSLQSLLAEPRRIAPQVAARWGAQLARAIDHAHRQGVWHRDLKPANILLEPEVADAAGPLPEQWEEWTPKLTDFGLAKLRDSPDLRSQSGMLLGTLAYMAPEQLDGRFGAVGPASDFYALGGVLYAMLSGAAPFLDEDPARVLQQVLHDEPRPFRAVGARVPRDLEAIVLKCLEKTPADRYATAEDLARDLTRFAAGQPTRARPLGWMRRGWRWGWRHPAWSSALAVIVLLLAVLGGHRLRLERAAREVSQLQEVSDDRQRELRALRYLGDLRTAYEAWEARDARQVQALLERSWPRAGEPDQRGFFWWHLWSLIHGRPRMVGDPAGESLAVAYHPGGKLLLTARGDGSVCWWEVESGELLAAQPAHAGDINCLAISADGERIASAGDDQQIGIWSTAGRRRESTLLADAPLNSVLFLPGGTRLVAADAQGKLTVWDVVDRAPRQQVAAHEGEINQVALSPDGALLASAGSDGQIKLWSREGLAPVRQWQGHDGSATAVAFSPDGKSVATAGVDHRVRVWRVEGDAAPVDLVGHSQRVDCLAFAGPQTLLSTGKDGTLRFWNYSEGNATWSYITGHERVWGVAVNPLGAQAATVGAQGAIRLWDLTQLDQPWLHWQVANSMSDAGEFLEPREGFASVFDDFRLCQTDLSNRVQNLSPLSLGEQQTAIRWIARRQVLRTVSAHGAVADFDLDGKLLHQWLPVHLPGTGSLCRLSEDGRTLVLLHGDRARELSLRDVEHPEQSPRHVQLPATCRAVRFVPRTQLAVLLLKAETPGEESIACFDLATGERFPLGWSHRQTVNDVAFSPDGKYVAYAGEECRLWLRRWDLPEAPPLALQTGDDCLRLAFVPGEPLLVCLTDAGDLELVGLVDGRRVTSKALPRQLYRELLFDEQGHWMALMTQGGLTSGGWSIYRGAPGNSPAR